MSAEFRRHGLDADLGGTRPDDDRAGPRPLLWRHGPQEERRRHGDDELRHHLPRHRDLRGLHLQHVVHAGHAVHRRAQSRLPAGHLERHLQRHRQSQSAGADDPRDRLFDVPAHLRDHHARAHRRLLRRTHEVLGDAVVHRPVGDLRLRAGRALGVGTGWLPQQRQQRRLCEGARLRRRHRRARQFRRRRLDVRVDAGQA